MSCGHLLELSCVGNSSEKPISHIYPKVLGQTGLSKSVNPECRIWSGSTLFDIHPAVLVLSFATTWYSTFRIKKNMKTICMKWRILLSRKNKKNISKWRLLILLPSMQSVKFRVNTIWRMTSLTLPCYGKTQQTTFWNIFPIFPRIRTQHFMQIICWNFYSACKVLEQ